MDLGQLILMRILTAHRPADPHEFRDLSTIIGLVQRFPGIRSRECLPGHVTGSALIIEPESGRVLLHHHRALSRWLQVGGHMGDRETDPAYTAFREACEESGLPDLDFWPLSSSPAPIDIDIHHIPAGRGMPGHWHLDFRYLLATKRPAELAPDSGESNSFRWIELAQAVGWKDELDPALRRLIVKAQALRDERFPS